MPPLEPLSGQPPSMEILLAVTQGYARRSARRLGLPEGDRDDVEQSALLAVVKSRGAFDPGRPLRPWIKTIAYRTARDQRRLARYEHEELGSASLEVADGALDPEARLIAGQTLQRLVELLGSLRPALRLVFVRHVLEDIPLQEIAEALAVPLATVSTRLRSARLRLRAAWARDEARRRGDLELTRFPAGAYPHGFHERPTGSSPRAGGPGALGRSSRHPDAP